VKNTGTRTIKLAIPTANLGFGKLDAKTTKTIL